MKTHGDVKLHRGTRGNALKCLTPLGQLLLQPANRVFFKKPTSSFLTCILTRQSNASPRVNSYWRDNCEAAGGRVLSPQTGFDKCPY